MSFSSKKTNFVFSDNYKNIESRPFEWEKYSELADSMSNAALVDFILAEMNNFQKD